MKAEEIDRKFDAGEDITEYLDVVSTRRPGQAIIKIWIAERLERKAS